MLVRMPVPFVYGSMAVHQMLISMEILTSHFRKFVIIVLSSSKSSFCVCVSNVFSNLYVKFLLLCSYVPTHLHLMVFELVKNSLRAVQEKFVDSDKVAPPIRIIVADGLEDVTIKVCYFYFLSNRESVSFPVLSFFVSSLLGIKSVNVLHLYFL